MAAVYSATFFEEHDLVGDGASVGPQPGFLWVVKGVDVVMGNPAGAVVLLGPAGQAVWANSFAGIIGFAYASYRGSFVVTTPETILVNTDAAMDVSVWGYNLTLP